MKTSLFTIEKEYLELINQIEQEEGVITPEMDELLKINKGELQSKSVAYLQVIKTKEGLNEIIDVEIKRLTALKKRNGNLVTNLRSRLLDAVKMFGDFEVGFNTFGTRKSSTVEVEFINELPKEYKTIKITESADKKAIKEAIKSGIKIAGCSIVEHKNLKIS